MADKDMQNELEQLRAEVAAISAARASKNAAETQPETSPVGSRSPETDDLTGDMSDIIENVKSATVDDPELSGQFDQLIEQLEHEIKNLPAITTLAVFSLGVLFGRLLR